MLSLGKLEIELDLIVYRTLRDVLCHAKIIGDKTDPTSLQEYSNQLFQKVIEELLIFFPNSYRVLDTYITNAAHLFDDIVVRNILPITDLPPDPKKPLLLHVGIIQNHP